MFTTSPASWSLSFGSRFLKAGTEEEGEDMFLVVDLRRGLVILFLHRKKKARRDTRRAVEDYPCCLSSCVSLVVWDNLFYATTMLLPMIGSLSEKFLTHHYFHFFIYSNVGVSIIIFEYQCPVAELLVQACIGSCYGPLPDPIARVSSIWLVDCSGFEILGCQRRYSWDI